MLILGCRPGDSFAVGDAIIVKYELDHKGRSRLVFHAPRSVRILRMGEATDEQFSDVNRGISALDIATDYLDRRRSAAVVVPADR